MKQQVKLLVYIYNMYMYTCILLDNEEGVENILGDIDKVTETSDEITHQTWFTP